MNDSRESFAPITVEQIARADWGKKPIVYYMVAVWAGIFIGSLLYLTCLTYISLPVALCSIVLPLTLITVAVICIRRKVGTEYEYEFVDGLFTVSKIICRSNRELMCEFSCDDLQMMAPLSGRHLKQLDAPVELSLTAVPHDVTRGRWFILYSRGRSNFRMIFCPNEKMIDAFRQTLPEEKFFEQ